MADQRLIPSSIRDASTMAVLELIDRMGTLDITPLLVYLIDYVEESALPHLAEQFSVTGYDGWALTQGAADQRDVIKSAIELHRRKGTPWAVKGALAASGYLNSELIEHRQNMAAWLAAGGELLDGVGCLDGAGDLGGGIGKLFSFPTTHWAEYAIRLNIGEGEWNRGRQRQIAEMAAEYAPARCRLVAVIAFMQYRWSTPTLMLGTATRLTIRGRFHVPHFETLDFGGTATIGGESVPDSLDGGGTLDGYGNLDGTRPDGAPLSHGLIGLRLRTGVRLSLFASGGNRNEQPETLGSGETLDGRGAISGPLLDGVGTLDGAGMLWYPSLGDPDDTLAGTTNLGTVAGRDSIWFSARLTLRHGGHYLTEVIV